MKNQNFLTAAHSLDALQSRYALRVTSHLTERNRDLPHDITERLRVARERAVERARLSAASAPARSASVDASGAIAAAGGPAGGWWLRFASLVPLVALVGGLFLIQHIHTRSQIDAAAEMDTAVLADDLPLTAYSDPGFVEFLKSPRN
jgi:hypothetical protein